MISPPTSTSSRFVLEHSTTRDDGPRGAALPLSSAGAHPTSRRTAPRRVPAASGGGQGGLQLRRRAQVRAPFLRCRRSACRHAARAPPAGRRVRGSDSTDPSRSTAGLSLSAAPRAAAPKLASERPAGGLLAHLPRGVCGARRAVIHRARAFATPLLQPRRVAGLAAACTSPLSLGFTRRLVTYELHSRNAQRRDAAGPTAAWVVCNEGPFADAEARVRALPPPRPCFI